VKSSKFRERLCDIVTDHFDLLLSGEGHGQSHGRGHGFDMHETRLVPDTEDNDQLARPTTGHHHRAVGTNGSQGFFGLVLHQVVGLFCLRVCLASLIFLSFFAVTCRV